MDREPNSLGFAVIVLALSAVCMAFAGWALGALNDATAAAHYASYSNPRPSVREDGE